MKRILVALLCIFVGGGFLAEAAAAGIATGPPTTVSDQWWKADEAGWGAAVLQQGEVLFVCFFVYGSDGQPTWFVAVATAQAGAPAGHAVYSGKLYVTRGPYFAGPFIPAAVIEREAGSFSFDATAVDAAVIRYVVDGVSVVKPVTRQTWVYADLSGDYYGGFAWDQACGPGTVAVSQRELLGSLQVTHTGGNAVTATLTVTKQIVDGAEVAVPGNAAAAVAGAYTQSGHLGTVDGTFSVVLGSDTRTVPAVLFEIERTANGLTGRLKGAGAGADSCTYDGHFGAVRR